jgi:hypothetical protein
MESRREKEREREKERKSGRIIAPADRDALHFGSV